MSGKQNGTKRDRSENEPRDKGRVSKSRRTQQSTVSARTRNQRRHQSNQNDEDRKKQAEMSGTDEPLFPMGETLQSQPEEDNVSFDDSSITDPEWMGRPQSQEDWYSEHSTSTDGGKYPRGTCHEARTMRDPEDPEAFIDSRYANNKHPHFQALYSLAKNAPYSFSTTKNGVSQHWREGALKYQGYLAVAAREMEKKYLKDGWKVKERPDGFDTVDYKGTKVHRCMMPLCDKGLDWHTDLKPQFDDGMEWRRKLKQNKAGKAWGGFDLRMLEICEQCQAILRGNIIATGLDDDAHCWYVPRGKRHSLE